MSIKTKARPKLTLEEVTAIQIDIFSLDKRIEVDGEYRDMTNKEFINYIFEQNTEDFNPMTLFYLEVCADLGPNVNLRKVNQNLRRLNLI